MDTLKRKVIIQDFYPFFQCCVRAANELVLAEGELKELMRHTQNKDMARSDSERSFQLQHEIEMSVMIAPIFGIITLEQFIHSYAVERIKGFWNVLEHIDKLDTTSKWMVIPPLACGKEIERTCPALNDLRQLIKLRNTIIHPKPIIVNNPSEEQFVRTLDRVHNLGKERHQIAKKAPQTVIALINELRSIDNSKSLRKLVSKMKLQARDAI